MAGERAERLRESDRREAALRTDAQKVRPPQPRRPNPLALRSITCAFIRVIIQQKHLISCWVPAASGSGHTEILFIGTKYFQCG